MQEDNQEGTVIQSIYQIGMDNSKSNELKDYFLPAPVPAPEKKEDEKELAETVLDEQEKKPARAEENCQKMAKKKRKRRNTVLPRKEPGNIEKRKYGLDVLEQIIKEREETLTLHEHKVVAIKSEYEKKLEELKKREQDFNARVSDAKHFDSEHKKLKEKLDRLRDENRIAESILLEKRRETDRIKEKEMRLRIETSKNEKELEHHQKKFDELHSAITKLDLHLKKKQNEFETVSYHLGMKKHDHEDLKRQIAHLKRQHEKLKAETTYDIVNEIKILVKRIDDHLRHSDFDRARKDYGRIRELYLQLSREEKKTVYDKITKISVALT